MNKKDLETNPMSKTTIINDITGERVNCLTFLGSNNCVTTVDAITDKMPNI
jgi:hypothetical protein